MQRFDIEIQDKCAGMGPIRRIKINNLTVGNRVKNLVQRNIALKHPLQGMLVPLNPPCFNCMTQSYQIEITTHSPKRPCLRTTFWHSPHAYSSESIATSWKYLR